MATNPYAPPQSAVADVPQAAGGEPTFFAVSVLKLIILSLCTFGLYEIYWFYQNWKLIRDRTGENVWPLPRALFPVFFCYQLFKRIRDQRPDLDSAKLAAGPLATVWIILSLLWRAPDPYGMIVFAAVFVLAPVQAAANTVNTADAPGHDRNARFTVLNWIGVVPGGLLFLFALVAAFLPAV